MNKERWLDKDRVEEYRRALATSLYFKTPPTDCLRGVSSKVKTVTDEKEMRPFDVVVDEGFLEFLKKAGGWMISIDYKVGDKLKLWVEER